MVLKREVHEPPPAARKSFAEVAANLDRHHFMLTAVGGLFAFLDCSLFHPVTRGAKPVTLLSRQEIEFERPK